MALVHIKIADIMAIIPTCFVKSYFSSIYFLICFLIHFTSQYEFPCPPSILSHRFSLISPFPFPLREGKTSLGITTCSLPLTHQFTEVLGTYSPTKGRQGSSVRWTGNRFKGQAIDSGRAPISCCWGQVFICYVCAWGPKSNPWLSFGWDLPRIQLSWVCWSSCGSHVLFGSLNPSPNSSTRLTELHLMFGCGSPHLLGSGARWSFSEDSYGRLLSSSITEYH